MRFLSPPPLPRKRADHSAFGMGACRQPMPYPEGASVGSPVRALEHLVIGNVIKLPEARLGLRVAQQVLGRHHDQRLPELAVDLPPQQVEVVCRRRAIGNLRSTASWAQGCLTEVV